MPNPSRAQLFAEFQREPRRVRRSVSRDFARANPVAPRPASGGVIGDLVHRRPKWKKFHGALVAFGHRVPTSGQARINYKRNQRAGVLAFDPMAEFMRSGSLPGLDETHLPVRRRLADLT